MTSASAFHFASLVWDWPIAIYLFLIGISAGLVTLAILLRRFHPEAGGSDSTLLRTTLVLGPGAIIFGLLILVFHLTRPWTFWKLMFHYSFTSVMSMGVMLFQLYMVVLVLWLAKIFEKEVIALQQRWLPRLEIVQKVLALITPFHRALETLMLVLAVLLGAYTGFLLSALKSYPFLNNPILPALFLFSGISSGAAVALIAMALRHRSNPHSTEARFVHRMETPVVWLEIFLLAAFFIGLALGDDGKMRALAAALGGGFNAATAWVCWRWVLPGWCALTLGIILGSWWAYCELGWGGWWFWDPVENASLLPWLAASALLHSLYVSRQRGSFRHWSLLLAILTLILSLLGTLIVRSGILLSVHAFALDNVRAVPLFILFAALSLASLALYGWRAREPYPATRLGGGKCETLILTTLLLFSAVLLIVLVGTLYPMIYGLMGWGRLSVGAPYFNRVTLPFGLLMLVVIVLATIRSRKVSVRCQLPALLAHTGVFIFAAGIMVSSGSRHEISLNLNPGQQVVLAGYTFRFERLDLEAKGNYTSEKARITLWRNEKLIGSLQPERRFYAARRQQMMEPGIHWNLLHDWYAVMGEKTGPDRYAMRLYVQTGVRWIWGGGLLMVCGALLSGWRGRKHPELLPDGAALIRPTSEKHGRPDKAFTPPSGKTMLLVAFLIFLPFTTHAQVVDTWRFDNPQQQEKALSIASQLRCPQCQNQNLLESNAPVAVSMRHQVYSMVAEGKSEAEITAWMTDRYGDFVRYNPPLNEQTLLLWALPCLLLLLVGVVVWRVRKRQHAEEGEQ
ncbi:heme lyase NrfEFG subunit NrfF [Salmonella enterica]|uniref:Formate-dependent nitrite reductase complex subunit n=9 Tax=Enterobacteriaceae TaxID=543 RepID=A0A711EEH1_SALET|nr:heme lyase NrfEFG subunit NrfF [Salmonella enterica]EEF0401139.1 heme lyase NrfEFG subunit NrfF [Salmonella enterica subsp. enterica serovar Dublin]HAD2168687.1 heme lyase NrfEFG subunit NrfF [Salmonella enterica subsp. enterica]EAP0902081.1 heme lyase NrfEFG subunit NrfF [Salmonella enterica]EAS3246614.1 heme lyase NrfEFG subunit NrfF [Salmonella enterica]